MLIFLAGISISALTGSELFEKARLAKEKQENAQLQENTTLENYVDTVNEYLISANRDNEDFKFKECSIEISDTGTITVKKVENIYAFIIVKDGKSLDITKGNKYNLNIPINQTANINVIAIDENTNLYKSNVISYTKTGTDLYNYGYDNSSLTGGWKGIVQNSGNCKFSSLSDSIYI